MTVAHDDPYVGRLFEEIATLLVDGDGDPASIHDQLLELAEANSPEVARYWRQTGRGVGIPDVAYKSGGPHLFPDETPVRVFRTSGTTGSTRGEVRYTKLGLELKRLAVTAGAKLNVATGAGRTAVIRFAPTEEDQPGMAIAFDMARIEEEVGAPELSGSIIGPNGMELDKLTAMLDAAVAEGAPVVMVGATFAFVNVCDALRGLGRSWELPPGSKVVDGGGFKGRSRVMAVPQLRATLTEVFGVVEFDNIFGMTELAHQLFNASPTRLGPLGESPKAWRPWGGARLRAAGTRELITEGRGLVEVTDLCLLDRPCAVLTGDVGIGSPEGVAIAGRVAGAASRGCSLSLDEMTGGR
ncbi:acyl-CoA reductase [Actinosynnema pretiosum subsp. pretiosum]|uniref:Acyl-CoA reductase n=2 Tax=Actinosynnema TaxID=40566 RepID=A0AA45L7Q2_9PSEU|nr:ACP synthase [Actinosynnema mirum]ACU37608.1 putative acyl protein synthase/acyl-CoA reductase-like protein [Actinosynnema mirum DSM 43827]AXX31040.1 Long-chain-fatty-acid--luciferin-component ligase [Actinosynnema pretiosum subsp. pretiosum]QUF04871.1 acyl-CoA reductase [Actinosynnema pretiosum subsp. pretiosum]